MRVTTTLPLLALLLAGCGGGGEVVAVQTAAAPASTAAASPTPTVLTKAEAAQRYLQIVGPYNTAVAKLNAIGKQYGHAPTTAKVPASYRKQAAVVVTTGRAFISGLMSTPWPADVKGTAVEVADEFAPDVSLYLELSKASTWGDAETAFATIPNRGNGAAQKIRVQLGLPPAQ